MVFVPVSLLAALPAAALLAYLQLRSGIESYLVLVPAALALAYVATASGRLLLAACGERDGGVCAAWACGLIATCLALYALTSLFPLTGATAFGILAVAIAGFELARARRRPQTPADWRGLAGFALCAAFTAAWCGGAADAYEVLRAQGTLPVWGDHFIHGARISQFGDVRALGRESILLADFPSSFYHFASYLSAAPLVGMLDQPGLRLATSAWLPLGFLTMAAGAYALGGRLAGAAGGVAALAAVAILPDASNYGLRSGFLSFHWSLMAHPGAMYALGAAFISLALLERWRRDGSAPALVASGAIAVSILFFRAHIFLLYLPAWIATVIYCRARESGRQRRVGLWLVAGLGAAAALASLLASTHWRFRGPAFTRFLEVLHSGHEPTAYTGLYAELVSWYPWWFSLTGGIVLAFLAALGAFALLLPGAALVARRFGALRPLDVFPAFLAYCWLLLMLVAPATWALEGPELIDRPVVLLYAGAAIWTACLLLRCLAAPARAWTQRLWPAMVAASLVLLPAAFAAADGMARPKFTSGEPHMALRVEPGLVEAASFLRAQASVGDIFAAAGLKAEFAVIDLPSQLCSLSGLPAYLSRPRLEMIKDGPRRDVAAGRLAALAEVDRQTDYAEATAMLRRLGVQWYVVAGAEGPRWDPGQQRAAFRAGTIMLYATSSPNRM